MDDVFLLGAVPVLSPALLILSPHDVMGSLSGDLLEMGTSVCSPSGELPSLCYLRTVCDAPKPTFLTSQLTAA